MSPIRSCAVACALSFAPGAFAQIVNGGFEPAPGGSTYVALPGGSGAITGWTTTDTGVEWFLPAAFGFSNSPDGGWCVDLANLDQSAGGIEQSIPTALGQLYEVDFLYGTSQGSGRDGSAEITVSAGGTSQVFSIVHHTLDIVWESRSFQFVAGSTSTTLSFRCLQDANLHFANIDGVAMAAVPAPAAGGVVLVAGLGLGRRRRR
jgi:hypothetical protein